MHSLKSEKSIQTTMTTYELSSTGAKIYH